MVCRFDSSLSFVWNANRTTPQKFIAINVKLSKFNLQSNVCHYYYVCICGNISCTQLHKTIIDRLVAIWNIQTNFFSENISLILFRISINSAFVCSKLMDFFFWNEVYFYPLNFSLSIVKYLLMNFKMKCVECACMVRPMVKFNCQ